MKNSVAQVLRMERDGQNITQAEMAKVIGKSRRQYQRLESSGNFNLQQAHDICERLDLVMMILPKTDSVVKLLKTK